MPPDRHARAIHLQLRLVGRQLCGRCLAGGLKDRPQRRPAATAAHQLFIHSSPLRCSPRQLGHSPLSVVPHVRPAWACPLRCHPCCLLQLARSPCCTPAAQRTALFSNTFQRRKHVPSVFAARRYGRLSQRTRFRASLQVVLLLVKCCRCDSNAARSGEGALPLAIIRYPPCCTQQRLSLSSEASS